MASAGADGSRRRLAFPAPLFAGLWLILGLMYLLWGILLLPDVGWHAAERGMRLSVWGRPLGAYVSVWGNWLLLGSWLAFAPLALTRTTRPIGWMLALAANVLVLPLAGLGEVVGPVVLLHLLTFDPAWLPARKLGDGAAGVDAKDLANREVVFYDGHCGLCHGVVRFVLAEDAGGELFEFSPLGSAFFERTVSPAERAALPDSVVLRQANGACW